MTLRGTNEEENQGARECGSGGRHAVGGGIAYAAIPDADGVIHTCYHKNNGSLRVSDTGACKSNEVTLSWNHVGPAGLTWRGEWASGTSYQPRDAVLYEGSSYVAIFANAGSPPPNSNWMLLAAKGGKGDKGDVGATGPAGSVGPQGPQGEKGDTGPAGTSTAYEVRQTGTSSNVGDTTVTIVSMDLPAGSYVLQGKAAVQITDDADDTFGHCSVVHPTGSDAGTWSVSDDFYFAEWTVSMLDTVHLPSPATVSLQCFSVGNDVNVSNAVIVATEVSDLQ